MKEKNYNIYIEIIERRNSIIYKYKTFKHIVKIKSQKASSSCKMHKWEGLRDKLKELFLDSER